VGEGNVGYPSDASAVDGQGRFRLPVLPGVEGSFTFYAPGHGMRAVPPAFDASGDIISERHREGLVLRAGESRDLGTIVLTGGTETISGRLLNAHQKPISPAAVYFTTPSGTWEGRPDASGRFTLTGVVKGEQGDLFVIGLMGKAQGYLPFNWLRRGVIAGDMGTIVLTDKDLPPPRD
jgi:hypothetical protein